MISETQYRIIQQSDGEIGRRERHEQELLLNECRAEINNAMNWLHEVDQCLEEVR